MLSSIFSRIKNLSAGRRSIFSPDGRFIKANGHFIKADGRFIKANSHFIKANGRSTKGRNFRARLGSRT